MVLGLGCPRSELLLGLGVERVPLNLFLKVLGKHEHSAGKLGPQVKALEPV